MEGILSEARSREAAEVKPIEGGAPDGTLVLDAANEADFAIRPSAIKIQGHLWDAFDHSETEISASYVVRFCQEQGSWAPFTLEALTSFYEGLRKKKESFHWNRLIEPGYSFSAMRGRYLAGGGWVVEREGKFHVTADFIERCVRSTSRV